MKPIRLVVQPEYSRSQRGAAIVSKQSNHRASVFAPGLVVALMLGLHLAVAPAAHAQVILVSNPGPDDQGTSINPSNSVGVQFTLDSAWDIVSITAAMFDAQGFGINASNLTMRILADSSNSPGSILATSTTTFSTVPTSATDLTFAFSNPTLSAGTYWAQATLQTGFVSWRQTRSVTPPIVGPHGTITGRTFEFGFVNTASSPFVMTVRGVEAIPEPSGLTLAAFTGGAAVLAASARRVRRLVG
jgi:hypothetical protein